jgi:hypothetical protein
MFEIGPLAKMLVQVAAELTRRGSAARAARSLIDKEEGVS